jgi:nitric oxide reductase NorE protein
MYHGEHNAPALPADERGTVIPEVTERDTKQRIPGDASIWVFVIGEMVAFSCYFAAYMFDRGQNHGLFLQSQRHLSQSVAAFNTLVLLASSLFVALSVHATRAGDFAVASRFLTLGGTCGAGFVLSKAFEWSSKLARGWTLGTNAFFMHYYMLTGVHLFHVLVGLVFLGILWRELNDKSPPRARLVEVGATYWHMVDFLWIIIFPLLYLMR